MLQVPEPESPRFSSWFIVCCIFYFVFPVGIALIIRKLRIETGCFARNGKIVFRLGCVLAFLAIVFAMSASGDPPGVKDNFVSIFLLVAGMFATGLTFILLGRKYRKLGQDYARYRSLLQGTVDGSLQEVADAYPKSYQTVRTELQQMIDLKLFPGCSLDLARGKFVSPYRKILNGTRKVVICPNCGASNFVGQEGKLCDYCRSFLSC